MRSPRPNEGRVEIDGTGSVKGVFFILVFVFFFLWSPGLLVVLDPCRCSWTRVAASGLVSLVVFWLSSHCWLWARRSDPSPHLAASGFGCPGPFLLLVLREGADVETRTRGPGSQPSGLPSDLSSVAGEPNKDQFGSVSFGVCVCVWARL